MTDDEKARQAKEHIRSIQEQYYGSRFPNIRNLSALSHMQTFLEKHPEYHQRFWMIPKKQREIIEREFVSNFISDKTQAIKRLKSAIDAAYQHKMDNANRKTKKSKPTTSKPGYVYLLSAVFSDGNTHYKIGKTSNPSDRMKLFKVKLPVQPELIHLIKTDDMNLLEWELHNRFGDKCSGGEWHLLTPTDIAYIKSL